MYDIWEYDFLEEIHVSYDGKIILLRFSWLL